MSVRSMSPRRRTDPLSVLHVHVHLLWFIPQKGVAEELLCPRSKILGPCPGKVQTVCENAFSLRCTECANYCLAEIHVSGLFFFLFSFSSYTKRSPHYSKHSWNYTMVSSVILHPEKSQRNIRRASIQELSTCIIGKINRFLSLLPRMRATHRQRSLTVVNNGRCISGCYIENAFFCPKLHSC